MSNVRVWWVPQIPMEAFHYDVPDVDTGVLLCNALADYDLFQYDKNVKPDYCNTGGIQVRDPDTGDWEIFDYEDEYDINEAIELAAS